MFKTRKLLKQFDTLHDFGIKNLIVSGCSFTYNNSDVHLCTWPYYLRDLGGFEQVYDCSIPGAGNYHISHSLQWSLETTNLDPKESLVIVMWSGNDRDDCIMNKDFVKSSYPYEYHYDPKVVSGITGGSYSRASGNVDELKSIISIKTKKSRAVENYLYINSLKCYLTQKNYRHLFLNYMPRDSVPNWPDFEIDKFLPKSLEKKFQNLFNDIENIHRYSVAHDLLMPNDLFHPNPNGHLSWTKQILIPALKDIL